MKKSFYSLIILLITFLGIYIAVVNNTYNNRIKDATFDLVFQNTPSINESNLVFDYSSLKEKDNSLLGEIKMNLQLEGNVTNKAYLPFYGALNNEISNGHSHFGKNVEFKIDGRVCNYTLFFGKIPKEGIWNYNNIKSNLYELLYDDARYYVYLYKLNGERLGIDRWIANEKSVLTSNLKVKSKLSRREKKELKNTKYDNRILLEPTNEMSFIISKMEIDNYISDLGEKMEIVGTYNLYKYFLADHNVNLDLAISSAQNEYNGLFDEIGIHDINFLELINKERLMVYEIEVPEGTKSIDFKYNHIVGKDNRYNQPQYELEFIYNYKNYNHTKQFNVTYMLDDSNKYVNFTILNLEKIENGYKYSSTSIPKETKIFFSAVEMSTKPLSTFKVELAVFSKYILIPVLFCVLFVFIGFQLKKQNLKFKISIKEMLQTLQQHIPEILTFYLLAFKFFTLYVGDSSFNAVNTVLVLVFVICCFIYFICKTMTSVNYYKLIFYSILAVITGLLVQDVAFIMLIALSVCYLEKGSKPYLKAMYMGIAFFSVQTILLAGYNVIPNPSFLMINKVDIIDHNYRYALGFGHPNTVSLFLLVGCLCYILYKKPSWLARVIMFILTLVTYIVTRSRTGCMCILMLLFLDVLVDYVPLKGKWRYICVLLFPVFTIGTMFFARIFGTTQEGTVNQILSQRPFILNHYLNQNWITLTGIDQLADWLFIDNLYLNVLIFQGLPCYLIYFVVYTIVSYKAIESNHPKIFIGMLIYFIYSLFEATLMSYSCAIYIVLLFITTLGDKYYMDGSVIERRPRIRSRNLYIVESIENFNLDSSSTNIVLVLGKKTREEFVEGNKFIYITKFSIWKYLPEVLKYFDPDKIHLYVPNSFASFGLLFNVYKGELIVYSKNLKHGKLYKKATSIVDG